MCLWEEGEIRILLCHHLELEAHKISSLKAFYLKTEHTGILMKIIILIFISCESMTEGIYF